LTAIKVLQKEVLAMPSLDSIFGATDISTRPKRRRIVLLVIAALSRIRNAEMVYLERIPANLQGGDAYAAADISIDLLTDAIEALTDAY
jgi:hypothetical protein